MKLALKITPQRSTQYTNMVATLAMPELLASPLRMIIKECVSITLAGQAYLLVTLREEALLSPYMLSVLARMGATSEVYEYFDAIGSVSGPLLRPIEPQFVPFVPLEMAETRRYKGKTNEVFTRVLLNVALFAGDYSANLNGRLRILDPLAGGGTTLFLALSAGYDAFGIELNRQDVETTAVFARQYLDGVHIHYKERDERGRRAGRRYQFEIGLKDNTRMLVLVNGDTAQANMHMREVVGGPHVHAILGDLPYGIQHFGEISSLLTQSLPIWTNMLLPGGTLALAWNATRIGRAEMVNFLEQETALTVRNEPPYTQFAHTVDRVIKHRDIVVGVKRSA
ncbi:MAG: SAM-dependent methyltransferase [Ktedonobacteraceae bacterium]